MMTNTTETVTRYVGHCQICEGEFKLTADDHTMVHHGFKRPGHGSIVGDCHAVGAPAYEQSCEVLKDYTGHLHLQLKSSEEFLANLKAGVIKKLLKQVRNYHGYGRETVKLVEVVAGESDFDSVLRDRISTTEWDIRQTKYEISRCEKRIADWKPLPVRTVEEKAAEEQAAKDSRKAEKEAARAKRQEEAKARQAKADALKAKRQAIIDGFKAQFEALAKEEDTAARKLAAIELAHKTSLKKYSFFWARDLCCDEVLVTLGLAEVSSVTPNRTFYRYSVHFR